MAKKCLKCGYERSAYDNAPSYECPQCGAIYAKVEAAYQRKADADDAEETQPATEHQSPQKPFSKGRFWNNLTDSPTDFRQSPGFFLLCAVGCLYLSIDAIAKGETDIGAKGTHYLLRYAEHPLWFSVIILIMLLLAGLLFLQTYRCWQANAERDKF